MSKQEVLEVPAEALASLFARIKELEEKVSVVEGRCAALEAIVDRSRSGRWWW